MLGASAIFTSYLTRRRQLEKSNTITTSVVSFVPRFEANYPVPTFQKKWLGSWMKQWFYVKNDLN
jgi:hypothetical protein